MKPHGYGGRRLAKNALPPYELLTISVDSSSMNRVLLKRYTDGWRNRLWRFTTLAKSGNVDH